LINLKERDKASFRFLQDFISICGYWSVIRNIHYAKLRYSQKIKKYLIGLGSFSVKLFLNKTMISDVLSQGRTAAPFQIRNEQGKKYVYNGFIFH